MLAGPPALTCTDLFPPLGPAVISIAARTMQPQNLMLGATPVPSRGLLLGPRQEARPSFAEKQRGAMPGGPQVPQLLAVHKRASRRAKAGRMHPAQGPPGTE